MLGVPWYLLLSLSQKWENSVFIFHHFLFQCMDFHWGYIKYLKSSLHGEGSQSLAIFYIVVVYYWHRNSSVCAALLFATLFQISNVILYLVLLLNIRTFILLYVVVLCFPCEWMWYNLYIRSPVHGHLGCFHFQALMPAFGGLMNAFLKLVSMQN